MDDASRGKSGRILDEARLCGHVFQFIESDDGTGIWGQVFRIVDEDLEQNLCSGVCVAEFEWKGAGA